MTGNSTGTVNGRAVAIGMTMTISHPCQLLPSLALHFDFSLGSAFLCCCLMQLFFLPDCSDAKDDADPDVH